MNSGLDDVTLEEIACHAHTDIAHVRRTYQSISEELHKKAKIHDFIPLLAMNKVRAHFRNADLMPSSMIATHPTRIENPMDQHHEYQHHYAH